MHRSARTDTHRIPTRALSGRVIALSLLLLLGSGWAETAQACGVQPTQWALLAANGEIFSNARSLRLYASGSLTLPHGGAPNVSLRTTASAAQGTATNLTVRETDVINLYEVDLSPATLKPGTAYTIHIDAPVVSTTAVEISFMAIESVAEPTALGDLVLEQRDAGYLKPRGCESTGNGLEAVLALRTSQADRLWPAQTKHELWIDGKNARSPELLLIGGGAVAQRSARVRALAFCSQKWGQINQQPGIPDAHEVAVDDDAVDVEVPPGAHSFVWKSVFPSGAVLATPALQVDLSCPKGSGPGKDSGTAVADADDSQGEGFESRQADGCSLAVAGQGSAASQLLGLLALCGVIWSRRIRRAERRPPATH